jgi:Fe-S oxidoreductase
VITGCRRCADVCPVGADYAAMLADALDAIPEATPAKGGRLAEMTQAEARGEPGEGYASQEQWIGARNSPKAVR